MNPAGAFIEPTQARGPSLPIVAQVGREDFLRAAARRSRNCAPQTPGFPRKMNFFELFLNRLLTPEQDRSYTPPIDDVAADAAGAVRNLLETSRV